MAATYRTWSISYFFLYLLASQSPLSLAARVKMKSRSNAHGTSSQEDALDTGLTSAAKGTPDKDCPGCKAWTKSGCRKGDGCNYNYIWLDTPRQSCRYTDEYKLLPDQVANFFPTELKRLEEKAAKFAKSGCIYGGWWMKCYRRIQQILRLFNYVKKAHIAVLKDGDSHPAFHIVASDETKARIAAVSKNMGAGFNKHSTTKKFCFDKSLQKMEQIPSEVQKRKDAAAAAGEPISEDELALFEKSLQSAAMLEMMCTEVTEDQTQELQAKIEASGAMKDADMELDDIVDQTIKDNAEALKDLDKEDVIELEYERDAPDLDFEPDDHESLEPPQNPNGLIELQEEDVDDDLVAYEPHALVEVDRDNTTENDAPVKKKKILHEFAVLVVLGWGKW
jgi:hypothetical protein